MDEFLKCIECGEEYSPNEIIYRCRKCGDLLTVEYDLEKIMEKLPPDFSKRPIHVWKYRELLPSVNVRPVTLSEGGTTLYNCRNLAKKIALKALYVKNEGENPTGSFKDRGMTVGVTKALSAGVKAVTCASTGNTSSSLAAYASKAGLKCFVFIPSGKTALGKLAQTIMYGAKVIAIKGNFDVALDITIKLVEKFHFYLLNSINAFRLEGQKTLGFEIAEQLGWSSPDWIVLPVGNAGNISAIWKGLKEIRALGLIEEVPKMVGIQAEGASPIAIAVKKRKKEVEFIEQPETIATAIRIGAPVNWKKALRAIYESGGTAEIVSDEEIIEAQKLLARSEGIFVEPASAASIAGLKRLLENGTIGKDEKTVCITTGHGLKDTEEALRICEKPVEFDANLEKIARFLECED